MTEFDIPIFQKSYDLYKNFCVCRILFPKTAKHTIGERCENAILDMLEKILAASQTVKPEKLPLLEQASIKLNLLRILVRLLKDTKALDSKKYILLQTNIDEIGRMLGGWIKSAKTS